MNCENVFTYSVQVKTISNVSNYVTQELSAVNKLVKHLISTTVKIALNQKKKLDICIDYKMKMHF